MQHTAQPTTLGWWAQHHTIKTGWGNRHHAIKTAQAEPCLTEEPEHQEAALGSAAHLGDQDGGLGVAGLVEIQHLLQGVLADDIAAVMHHTMPRIVHR